MTVPAIRPLRRSPVFHDSIVVAPLKLVCAGPGGCTAASLPRLHRRGPIEASSLEGRLDEHFAVFHDSIVVAPLKLGACLVMATDIVVFHDSIVVAPLKRALHCQRPLRRRRVFHDSIVVAPLKL